MVRDLIEIFGFQSICSKCDEILRFDDRHNRPPHPQRIRKGQERGIKDLPPI